MWSIVGVVVFTLVLFVVLLVAGWVAMVQIKHRNRGLPAPTFASYNPFSSLARSHGPPRGGMFSWIGERVRGSRSAAGAYEHRRPVAGEFGRLDGDDEAWDSRVGHDDYGADHYREEGHELRDVDEERRGRPTARSAVAQSSNPFDDDAEAPVRLRAISPNNLAVQQHASVDDRGSPDRRSVFHEEM